MPDKEIYSTVMNMNREIGELKANQISMKDRQDEMYSDLKILVGKKKKGFVVKISLAGAIAALAGIFKAAQ